LQTWNYSDIIIWWQERFWSNGLAMDSLMICAVVEESMGWASDLRSKVRAFDSGQCVHIPVLLSPRLVWAKERWRCASGKATVVLASHWPTVIDFSDLSTYALKPQGLENRDELYGPWTPHRVMCTDPICIRIAVTIRAPASRASISKKPSYRDWNPSQFESPNAFKSRFKS